MARTGSVAQDGLRSWGEGLWTIDAPPMPHLGLSCPTRATVVRLADGALWVLAAGAPETDMRGALGGLGPVRHLVASNPAHHTHLGAWHDTFPEAALWATQPDPAQALDADRAETVWEGVLDQRIVQGSTTHREAVFFHRASRTLILTDLIVALDTARMPAHLRPLVWLRGLDDGDPAMPGPLRRAYRDRAALARSVEEMIAWAPARIILCHGRCYGQGAVALLERAFRKVLREHRWSQALDQMQARDGRG